MLYLKVLGGTDDDGGGSGCIGVYSGDFFGEV